MGRYISYEDKLRLVQKALNQPERSTKEIAIEASVGYSSLQRWLKLHNEGKLTTNYCSQKLKEPTYPDKLEIVLHPLGSTPKKSIWV